MVNTKRNIIIIIGAAIILIFLSIYSATQDEQSSNKLTVFASFYPLGHFTEQVGGDTVTVKVVTPPGVEAHDFEPSPRDIVDISNADIFIYNGGGFDPWAEKLAQSLHESGIIVINMSEALKGAISEPSRSNPHFWLDPILALSEVEVVRAALTKKNVIEENLYRTNADIYSEKLLALHMEYGDALASCALRDIIVSHAAFEYLGTRYTIGVHAIAGVSPDEEPSPKELGELATFAREKGIKHIFFETAVSPKLAETIAQEVQAETLVLNPIETLTEEEVRAGEDYISVMKKNLNNLKKALQCI